jgi:hypothetical protein
VGHVEAAGDQTAHDGASVEPHAVLMRRVMIASAAIAILVVALSQAKP